MKTTLGQRYQFDLREEDRHPTLDEFREQMAEMGTEGWEFAGSVTLDVGEVTVWRER
jgi:hypothetical protein